MASRFLHTFSIFASFLSEKIWPMDENVYLCTVTHRGQIHCDMSPLEKESLSAMVATAVNQNQCHIGVRILCDISVF